MQRALGTCLMDQYLWDNPLSMGDHGYEGRELGATTGGGPPVLDGIVIDGPEAVARHLESLVFPAVRAAVEGFDEEARFLQILTGEAALQERIGPTMLKSGRLLFGFEYIIPGILRHTDIPLIIRDNRKTSYVLSAIRRFGPPTVDYTDRRAFPNVLDAQG